MKESTLLKISLISSLIGVLLLLVVSTQLKVDEKLISEIDETNLDSQVRINGVVVDSQKRGTVTLINLAQLEEMQIVVFTNITLNKGDYIEVTGKIGEYENQLQLVADKIVLK